MSKRHQTPGWKIPNIKTVEQEKNSPLNVKGVEMNKEGLNRKNYSTELWRKGKIYN